MNRITTNFLMAFALLMAFAVQGQVTAPRPSPAAQLTQTVGLAQVTVNYSRPLVIRGNNDRTGQIWGTQIGWGFTPAGGFGSPNPKPWRAGANENTVITFSHDLQVEGKTIKAGSYGLHMVPFEDGKVTVIFSNNTTSWGSFWYDESEDEARVDVQMKDAPFTNVLTYEFTDFTPLSGTLALTWESKQIPINISMPQEMVLQSFKDELRGTAGFNFQGPLSAANYCLNNNIANDQGLAWADQAIAANKNGQTMGVKSALLFQKGDKEEALKIANEAKEIATKNELNQLGYQLVGAGELATAEKFFKLNIKKNPDDPNMYDSMGECYVAMGKNDEAIKMFKKCLSMNPPQFVKANSVANLQRLGIENPQ